MFSEKQGIGVAKGNGVEMNVVSATFWFSIFLKLGALCRGTANIIRGACYDESIP